MDSLVTESFTSRSFVALRLFLLGSFSYWVVYWSLIFFIILLDSGLSQAFPDGSYLFEVVN